MSSPPHGTPDRTTSQLILALMELARLERQIQRARATDHDEAQLRALEECRAALLRIASRRIDPPRDSFPRVDAVRDPAARPDAEIARNFAR